MREESKKQEDVDLDLPALDGEGDDASEERESSHDDLLATFADDGDALDDRTGEDAPIVFEAGDETAVSFLDGAEGLETLDVGVLDGFAFGEESTVVGDDVESTSVSLDDESVPTEEVFVVDSGEEGPLEQDEELRDEDLPRLDADDLEEGEVAAFDPEAWAGDEGFRWDDRAWNRVVPSDSKIEESDESGVLPIPGADRSQIARDATWRKLDESGRLMASALIPGGSVVVAVSSADRARALVVRIQIDGVARVIAEIDPRLKQAEDDGEPCLVHQMRWNSGSGELVIVGNFGVEAYRPVS